MHGKLVWHHHPFPWVLVLFFALAVANGLILPAFEAIDEPEHFNFVRYLANGYGLPDQRDPALAEEYGYGQEGGQAPLYYLLGALVLRGLGEDVSDVGVLTVPDPLSTCGDTAHSFSKGLWMRTPERERWPYRGAALGVHGLRVFSAALGLLTVSGVYLAARTTFPERRPVALVAAALVGFNPRFLVHSATVTNDNLLAALAAWGIYLTLDVLCHGPSLIGSLALGMITGLVALTKVSGLALLPLVGLALADLAWRGWGWVRCLRHLVLIGLVCLVIAGWWYAGNLIRYGSLGLIPLVTQSTGRRSEWPPRLVIPETLKVLASYWASSPYCEIRLGIYPVYAALSLLGLGGLALWMGRAASAARRPVALLLVWVGVIFLTWFRFNAMVWAPDGRYLFPAHAAIAPLLATGLLALVGRWSLLWRGLVVGLGVLAMATPVGMLAPLFSPPPRYPAHRAPAIRPLDASFGKKVGLLGYTVSDETLRAGDVVDVTLYLEAKHPITENLALGLQIVSAGPYDDAKLVNLRSWPGGGNYPTTAWQPGEIVADRYRLRLPRDVTELQMWNLVLLFSHPSPQGEGYERLPVRVGGVPGDAYVVLTHLRVEPGATPSIPADAELPRPPTFGPGREVELAGAKVVADGARLHVFLWWRVHEPPGGDYKVFVQLLDQGRRLQASGDDFPRSGAMPTGYWRSGDLIVDEHEIQLPENLPPGDYHIGVGLYDSEQRLPAWDADGQPLLAATAIVGEWR